MSFTSTPNKICEETKDGAAWYRHSYSLLYSHIFLELCTGGDLLQFIEDRVQVGEGESKYIGLQLIKALNVR